MTAALRTAIAASMLVPLLLVAAAPVAAQPASLDAETARFLARARAGTARYRSQDAAIADGYKRVGVEFPAMGEHWVHLGRVLEDSLIPERPSILIYVNVGGQPRFAGVAYTDLLAAGEAQPTFPAPGGWHEHNGTVDEESFPLAHGAHAMAMTSGAAAGEVRLSVLHAWVGIANPDGPFVTDNWALPLARLELGPQPSAPRAALRALALAGDDEGYLLLTLRTALGFSQAEEAIADRVIARQRTLATREAAAVRAARTVDAATSARLAALWGATWDELGRVLPARAGPLRALRRALD